MITIEKKEIKSCCGKKSITWKLNTPIQKEWLDIFQKANFFFLKAFYDAGQLYIEDNGLIVKGFFGQNIFTLICKNKQCEDSMRLFERTILANL